MTVKKEVREGSVDESKKERRDNKEHGLHFSLIFFWRCFVCTLIYELNLLTHPHVINFLVRSPGCLFP